MDNYITIAVLIVLILLSSFFSATETAFSSLNRIRVKNLVKNGNKRAEKVLELSESYDRVLSTILIGNNIVNIVSASMATVLFVGIYGSSGVTISTIVMTVVVLIFGEITPKSLAKKSPEKFAMMAYPLLRIFMIVLIPLNFIFMQWQKLISVLFKTKNDLSITEEELLTIVEEAENEGGIDLQDGELIRSAIEFNDLDVVDILTPRVDVVAIDENSTQEEIRQRFFETGYSRLPVYRDTIDHIIGFINHKDFSHYVDNGGLPLSEIIKPVEMITASMKISKLLTLLQQKKCHIAVVFDEYGGTAGIVTLEDVIEELVGEIWDEHDEVIDEMIKISESEYKVLGKASLYKLFDAFEMEDEFDVNTVGGWIVEEMERVPEIGESYQYKDLTITITDADDRHVIEMKIVKEIRHEEESSKTERIKI
ncbi:hemolysin family protein [Eubacteriaceae bacterium ES3]|nr:hemolysin family protein [Eubacteriaceae bacterium ES3]